MYINDKRDTKYIYSYRNTVPVYTEATNESPKKAHNSQVESTLKRHSTYINQKTAHNITISVE